MARIGRGRRIPQPPPQGGYVDTSTVFQSPDVGQRVNRAQGSPYSIDVPGQTIDLGSEKVGNITTSQQWTGGAWEEDFGPRTTYEQPAPGSDADLHGRIVGIQNSPTDSGFGPDYMVMQGQQRGGYGEPAPPSPGYLEDINDLEQTLDDLERVIQIDAFGLEWDSIGTR